jgi:hypothetical protein
MGKIARSMIFCIFNDEKSKRNKRKATRKLQGLVETGKFVVMRRQEKHGQIKLGVGMVAKDRKVSAWARQHSLYTGKVHAL